MEIDHVMVILIGIVGSSVIHFSQGLMRLGIMRKAAGEVTKRTRWIYGMGVALNLSAPLWVVLANRFGPTTLYTSMYAAGIIVLILFSNIKLGAPFRARDLTGSIFLIAGTALLGMDGLGNPTDMSTVDPVPLLLTALVAFLLIWPLGRYGHRLSIIPQGLLFGMLGGGFLALDSLLKGVAQYDSGSAAFVPSTGPGLMLFVLSFIGAAAAFGMTQWAHFRNARASETIAGYDAAYVALPVLILPLTANDSTGVSTMCYAGLVCLGIGLFFMVSGRHEIKST